MITKPDLLFIKDVFEQNEEKGLGLSSLKWSKGYDGQHISFSDIYEIFNKDLIANFSPNVEVFDPDHFPKDLGLDTLVNEFLSPKYSGGFIYHALSRAPTDCSTIQFRWEILDELLQNRKKVKYLNEVCEQLYNITWLIEERKKVRNKAMEFHFDENDLLRVDIHILQQYVECVKAFAEVLEGSASKGLASLYDYSKKLMKNDQFNFLSEQLNNFLNNHYVELGVKLDAQQSLRKVKFLDTELYKLKRPVLTKIRAKSHQLSSWNLILNCWPLGYTRLVAMAFDDIVEDSLKQIKTTTQLIGDIEFYTSAIKFYDILKENNIPVTRPKLIGKENRTHYITNMRNPMVSFIKVCGKGIRVREIVPNSMNVDPQHNVYIITGANGGGKTCYVKSIGLVHMLAQSGYHIPVEVAEMSIVDNIYTHFALPDETTQPGGRWKNELKRVYPIWDKVTPYSLCLIDDLGSGTNFEEAEKPILTIIYGFYKTNATIFMNSHLHKIADVIEKGEFPGASNLQDKIIEKEDSINYTYKIIPGKAGKSYAAEVASAMGINKKEIDSLFKNRVEKGEIPKDLLR